MDREGSGSKAIGRRGRESKMRMVMSKGSWSPVKKERKMDGESVRVREREIILSLLVSVQVDDVEA